MSSAKAVTKELLASQKFLAGLQSLPSYGDTEGKQAMVLLQVNDNLSSDQAAGILQLLDEQISKRVKDAYWHPRRLPADIKTTFSSNLYNNHCNDKPRIKICKWI